MKGGFASHLHQALQEAGCRPFLDKPALKKGEDGHDLDKGITTCADDLI